MSAALLLSLTGYQPAVAQAPPLGEIPSQEQGSAAGRSHTVPPESTRADPAQRPGPQVHHDAPPATGGLGPDVRHSARRLEPQPAEVAEVRVGAPQAPVPAVGFDEATSTEDLSRRGRTTQVFDNADGTRTLRAYQGPAFFQQADGSWDRIAAGLLADDRGWRTAASPLPIRFAPTSDTAVLASVQLDRDTAVAFGAAATRAVAGQQAGDSVTYPQAKPGADLHLQALPSGIKETIVLHSPAAATEWEFPLQLTGLTASLADGGVRLTDAGGTLRAVIPPGFMEDSALDPRSGTGARSYGVSYELAGDTLRVRLDQAWLADPARVFPVRADPSVFNVGTNGTTFVQSPYTNDHSGSVDLWVGTFNGGGNKAAAYLKFDSLYSQLAGNYIMGAQLQLYETYSYSCNPRDVYVHEVVSPWSLAGNKTWPGPAYGPLAGQASFAAGYSSACYEGGKWQAIPLGQVGVTAVQNWAHGGANHGLTVRASETDSYGWKKFAAANSGNPPYLQVTYTPYWAAYQVGAMSPVVSSSQNGAMQVTVTNQGRDTWTPTNGYELFYRLWDGSGNELPLSMAMGTPVPTTVARDQSVTINATVRSLPPGTYTLRWDMNHNGYGLFSWHGAPLSQPVTFTVPNQSPVIDSMSPASGFTANTLTPTLRIAGHDRDSWPGTGLAYVFKLCDAEGDGQQNCIQSGWISSDTWSPPAGALRWGRSYVWYASVGDWSDNSPWSLGSYLTTQVPQPAITSHLASAATESDRGFDPGVGTYTTRAVDADVAVVGPDLSVTRTYNSLDPRRGNAFGAGWSSPWDTSLAVDTDGSGNVVVTYPDGQQARYGRHQDGTFAPPLGRFATLVATAGGWTLTTKGHTTYTYNSAGRLTAVTDGFGRTQNLVYDGTGALSTITDAASGRSLSLTWTGSHVTQVSTGSAPTLTWNYSYSGDRLTSVCDPTAACTTYDHTGALHYRTVALDANPWGYWRLSDAAGASTATNLVPVTGTSANGSYTDVTLGAASAMPGSGIGSGSFNGTSSFLRLPDNALLGRTHLAVELWFRTTSTTGGVLLGSGWDRPDSPNPTGSGMPILYVGTDGKLRGRFWNGNITGIASAGVVTDGNWHHVVLSGALNTQTLYLDGVAVGSQAGTFHNVDPYNHIGVGWLASQPWTAKPAGNWGHFAGQVSDVALYDHPLGTSTVAEHWAGRLGTDVLTKITAPGGRVAAQISYSTAEDRVATHTDANGGTRTLGAPVLVDATATTVAVTDPAGDATTYTYDPGRGGRLTTITDSAGTSRHYGYDSGGFLNHVGHWILPPVTYVNDARGNVLSRSSCRSYDFTVWSCTQRHTRYYSYYLNSADPLDPRNDRITSYRDARSASASDNTYLTEYTYTAAGDPATTTVPGATTAERRTTSTAYTTGTEPAINGGLTPAGLVRTTTTPGGRTTTHAYTSAGDLAQVTDPVGLVTTFGYDGLGRLTSRTVAGATTTFTYDAASRLTEELSPAVSNAVTEADHQVRTTTAYHPDGTVESITEDDVTGTDPDRVTSYTYDTFGRRLTTTDPAGGVTRTEFDAFGALSRSVDAAGTELTYTYTTLGHQPATTTVKGFTGDGSAAHDVVLESRAYDLLGRLGTVTDAMGRTHGFAYWDDGLVHWNYIVDYQDPITGVIANAIREITNYDGEANLTSHTDPDGHQTRRTWDPAGRLAQLSRWTPSLTRSTDYSHDLDDGVTGLVDRDGAASVTGQVGFTLDARGRELTRTVHHGSGTLVTTTTRDERGLAQTVTDPRGAVTTQAYDVLGRPTVTTAPEVAVESGGGAPATVAPVSKVGYNAFGEVVDTADPNGKVTHTTVDLLGRPTGVTLPSYTPPAGGPAITPTTTVGYDQVGRVTSHTDALGHATTFGYDQLGNPVRRTDPVLPGQPAAGVWTATYDPLGEQLSATDPTGAQTHATYDRLGRVATTTVVERVPAPTRNLTTRYGHNGNGQLTTVITPAGHTAIATYDDLGNLRTVTDPTDRTTEFGYDAPGRLVSLTDPLGNRSTRSYDLAGRLTSTSDLDPAEQVLRSSSYSYDAAGNQTTSTDPLGATTTRAFDALGRLTSVTWPVSGTASLVTSYGYDAAGNVTRATDGNGNATVFTVNPWNLPESTIEPATPQHPAAADRTFTASYDAVGRQRVLAKPGGVSVTTSYDPLGNRTQQSGEGASVTTADRVFGHDLVGRPTSISAPGGTSTIGYDDRGNVVSTAGPSGTSSATWDSDGRQASAVTPAGTTTYGYDGAGRLATAADPLTGATATYGYDDAGQLTSIGYGTGAATRTLAYDDLHRLVSDTVRTPAGTATSSVTYGYDDADQLTSKTTAAAGTTVANTYGYDRAGRLTSWSDGTTTKAYTWDNASNLTSDAAAYNQRNQLQSRAGTTYTHTPRGTLATRTTAGTTVSSAFNAYDERLTDGSSSYTYDALNRLIGAGTRTLAYRGASDRVTTDGVFTYSQTPDGTPLGVSTAGASSIAQTDLHTDLITQFSPATGALTGSRRYDPFGAVQGATGTQASLGYQHQWTDPGNGHTNMGARWYQPDTGTFASRDTAALDPRDLANANRHAYAAANPLTNTDPTGHFVGPAKKDGGGSLGSVRAFRGPGGVSFTVIRPAIPARLKPLAPSLAQRVGSAVTAAGRLAALRADSGYAYPSYRGNRPDSERDYHSSSGPRVDGSGRSVDRADGRVGGRARPSNGTSTPQAQHDTRAARVTANALRPTPRPPDTITIATHIQILIGTLNDTPALDLGILTAEGEEHPFPFQPGPAPTGPGPLPPVNPRLHDACFTGGDWTTLDGYTYTRQPFIFECTNPPPLTQHNTPQPTNTDAAAEKLPHGFASADEFANFSSSLRNGLSQAGFDDVTPILQGSAVTGKSFKTGQAFDVGRVSDFDVALASSGLLSRASSLGIGLRSGGTRTGPLRPADLHRLGLSNLAASLSGSVGRSVNFMIYKSADDAISRAPSVVLL